MPYRCPKCNKTISTRKRIIDHMKSEHDIRWQHWQNWDLFKIEASGKR